MTWYHECLVAGPCLSCYFRCSIFLLVWPLSLQCTDWITIEVQLFIWLQISFNLHDCINFNLFVFFPFHKDLVSLSRTILILFLPFFFCCFHYAAWTNTKWEFTTGVWSKYLPQCVSDFLHVLSPLCYLLFFWSALWERMFSCSYHVSLSQICHWLSSSHVSNLLIFWVNALKLCLLKSQPNFSLYIFFLF